MNKNSNTRLFLTVLAASLGLIVMGRVSTQFTAIASTDIAFPEWVSFVFAIVSELIVCARIVMGCAGLAQCAYHPTVTPDGRKHTALAPMLTMVLALSLADYLARFLVDFLTGAVTGMEGLALIWLLMQFLYEAVFIVMSMLLILLQARKFAAAETARSRERHSPAAAVRCAACAYSRPRPARATSNWKSRKASAPTSRRSPSSPGRAVAAPAAERNAAPFPPRAASKA